VVVTGDGARGLERAKADAPDLILMDLSLPVMDGWEASRQLKAAPRTRAIPIIALSAHVLEARSRKALAAGCDDFDMKPVELDRLLGKIDGLLKEEAGVTESTACILVVDDVDDNRFTLEQRLRRSGYENVEVAANGRQAIAIMEAKHIDLVLLDIMMPEMDGYQTLEHIKRDMRLRHIPVIMISAIDEIESAVRCIELGAEDYLPKPFNATLLRARIGASLERSGCATRKVSYLEEIRREKQHSTICSTSSYRRPRCVIEIRRVHPATRRYDEVAILFCDIVGFTAFYDRHRPEVVDRHRRWSGPSRRSRTRSLRKSRLSAMPSWRQQACCARSTPRWRDWIARSRCAEPRGA
jgi:CheY-like chemotaxis protein